MDEVVEAAVEWWARQLDHPQFHNGGGVLADVIATRLSIMLEPLADEVIDQFRNHLRRLINGRMTEVRQLVITTDYHPDKLLSDALTAAGITDGEHRLPIKTEMAIDVRKVRVAQGRDAKLVRVFPK